MKNVGAFFTIFWFTLVFALGGCTKKNLKTDFDLLVSETLRINLQQEPPSLDWNKSTDLTSSVITNNIMEGLVDYNLEDPELGLSPGLALEWKADPLGKVWTFKLRSGVVWSDGVKFEAQQVVDGWERLLNPATASEYAYFLYAIKNAKKFHNGELKNFSEVGVQVLPDGNLRVELEYSMSYFPSLLTHHSTFPIRKDLIVKFGDRWTEANHMVVLGPYKLKIWNHDQAIVMERNEFYYGEKAKIKYVLCYMINELTTAINLFDSGKLDLQNGLPSREIKTWRQRKEYVEHGLLTIFYYGFNIKKAPFNNLKVRQAFASAIDRKQITDMLAGGQTPLLSWVPPGMMGYNSQVGIKFNPDNARRLLDEAGFKDRSLFPKVKLAFNTNEDQQRIAENIQAQIKKNLSIEMELVNEEWKVYLTHLRNDTPSIYRLGWTADYPDPDNFMNLMAGFSDNNHTGWKDKAFDELITQAAGTLDKNKRLKLYDKAQKILTEEATPVIPLYSGVSQSLVAPRVKGLVHNGLSRFVFKKVRLE